MSKPLSIQPLTPSIGAEISGIDLPNLKQSDIDTIRKHWLKHKLVFIRNLDLSLDDLVEFSQYFGPLLQLPYIEPMEGYPQIIQVLKEADEINMGVFGGDWHSDFSFLGEPPMASILYANQVPRYGGDTLWINMTQAWQTLSNDLRHKIAGKIAIHTGAPYGVKHAPDESTQFKGSISIARNNPEADTETRHPAICHHPQTGEDMLFINPTYTTRIDGYDETESKELLNKIYQHCTRPEFSCRLTWQPGTLAIWDNRNTMHYAVNDYDGHRRCLYRTTIAGHTPQASD